jgi:competence protein ComEA
MSREQQGVILFLTLGLGLFFLLTVLSPGEKETPAFSPGKINLTRQQAEGKVLLEVDGNVNQRGMVQVVPGSPLQEALDKAGGVKGGLSLPPEILRAKVEKSSRLNILPDGDGKGKILLEPLAPPKLKVLSVPIPINTATVEELDILPGIGAQTAQAIIEYREAHGKFLSPEDLLRVPGIGPKKLAALKSHITVE